MFTDDHDVSASLQVIDPLGRSIAARRKFVRIAEKIMMSAWDGRRRSVERTGVPAG
jgi:hypothetical protein